MIIKDEPINRELPTEGIHLSVCSAIVDIGMQPGMNGSTIHKVAIVWELDQRIAAEGEFKNKRMIQSKEYNASMNKDSNLRKDVEAWLGRGLTDIEVKDGFDLDSLIGMTCTLSLVKKISAAGKERRDISAIMPPYPNAEAMKVETPGYIPKYLKDKITAPQQADMGEQKEEKARFTRIVFDQAIDKGLKLDPLAQGEYFNVLLSKLNKVKMAGECSEELYTECKFIWETTTGKKAAPADFDDLDVPF
jgi:hypothetical protein